jgi:hypothetical protein
MLKNQLRVTVLAAAALAADPQRIRLTVEREEGRVAHDKSGNGVCSQRAAALPPDDQLFWIPVRDESRHGGHV